MKKVLVLSAYYPPNRTGTSLSIGRLCKYLPKDSFLILKTAPISNKNIMHIEKFGSAYNIPLPALFLRFEWIPFMSIPITLITVLTGFYFIITRKVKIIVGVYPSISFLFSSYLLHLFTRLPFIVFMQDLYAETKNRHRHLFLWLENLILHSARDIIVVTDRMRDVYVNRSFSNIHIIPHSIDLADYKFYPQQKRKTRRIVFTGLIYGAQYDAVVNLLEAAKQVRKIIKNLEVIIATPSDINQFEKSDFITFMNLPHEDSIKLQQSADILFLPLAFNSQYPEEIRVCMPSKITEYLAAKKPILVHAPEDSFIANFVKKNGLGVVVGKPEVALLSEAIISLLKAKRVNRMREIERILKRLDSRVLSEKFKSILS